MEAFIEKIRHLKLKFPFMRSKEERTAYSNEIQLILSDHVVPSRRSFNEYMYLLGIKPGELGEVVLDLGSGMDEKFSKQAIEFGIQVYSVNPKLLLKRFRDEAHVPVGDIEWQGRSVAALSQDLPFKDQSFDSIVAVESIPEYLEDTYAAYYDSFREMVRVLKPGGKAFINIAVFIDRDRLVRIQDIFKKLDQLYGVSFSFPCMENEFKVTQEQVINGERGGFYTDMIVERRVTSSAKVAT